MGDRQTAAAAMRIAQKLDPKAWVARHRKAVSERRVSIRPAPDLMGYVSALLPVAKAVAVYAALNQYANTATAVGDDRSRGQLMADEFVHRVTNPQATAATTPAAPRNTSSPSAPGGSPTSRHRTVRPRAPTPRMRRPIPETQPPGELGTVTPITTWTRKPSTMKTTQPTQPPVGRSRPGWASTSN